MTIAGRFRTRTARWAGQAALLALTAGLAAPALAQDADQGPVSAQEPTAAGEPSAAPRAASGFGDDIIVTAQRRTESIQDVPIAITAIGSELLKAQNIQSVEDYFALTPNVSFQSNGARDRRDLSIRGISNQLNPLADVRQGSYAFYIDEFNVAAGTSNPQIVDLERIEVLRGPQGTYFGRNSVGGAINVITRKPIDEWEGEVELGYSSFDTWRAQGVVNVPVAPGILAIRASGQYEESDGYIKNINPIGGGNDSRYYTGRVQARFTPLENLTWDFTYSTSDERVGMRNGVPTGYLTATWRSVYYGNRPGDIADPDGVGFYPENRTRVNFNRPQRVGSKFDYFSTRAVWDFDVAALTAVFGHLDADVFNFGDVDGGSPDFFYEDLVLNRKSTSAELRLQSQGTNVFDWSIGTSVGRDTGVTDQSTFHGAQSPLCPAATGGRCEGLEVTGLDSDSSTNYFALFAQGTYNVTDQLSATLGLRYSYERTTNLSQTRSNNVVTGINDRAADFEDISPKFTLSYKARPGLLFFATASKGFKSGGTQITNNVNLPNSFEPETLWNYELGTKFDLLDGRMRVDITGFYMDWKDVQQTVRFQFIDPVSGLLRSVSGIENAASAKSYGIEGSFDLRLTDELRLSANAGYNKSKFGSYPNALIDGIVIDISGRTLVNAPRWTLGAQAQYTVPVANDFDGFVRAEWNFRDKMLSTQLAYRYNEYPFISPSYHNVNLRVGVENEKIRAVVYVENLFDAKYFANTYEKAFYSGVQVEPSYRTIGVNLGYKF